MARKFEYPFWWDEKGLPRKGWILEDVIDTGEDNETCEMCKNPRVRYLHVLSHNEWPDAISVGCVCAEHLTEDYVNHKAREKILRRKAARRKKFFGMKWEYVEKGNKKYFYKTYRKKEVRIRKTMFSGNNFGIYFEDKSIWYNDYGHKITDFSEAEEIAFKLLEESFKN